MQRRGDALEILFKVRFPGWPYEEESRAQESWGSWHGCWCPCQRWEHRWRSRLQVRPLVRVGQVRLWCVCCVLNHFSQSCLTLRPYGLTVAGQFPLWDSPGRNTRVGCHALLQGIFPTQGLNPCLLSLLHWQAGSLPLGPPGKPVVWRLWWKWKWSHSVVSDSLRPHAL